MITDNLERDRRTLSVGRLIDVLGEGGSRTANGYIAGQAMDASASAGT